MALSKLSAVNGCLAGISLAPVASVTEADLDLDAADALEVIDSITEKIQTEPWWFNTENNWKLTPDPVTGYILAPPTAASIITSGVSREDQLVIRGNKIYDLYNHTFDLRPLVQSDTESTSDYIMFSFLMILPFEDLPPVVRRYISDASKRIFAQNKEVDERRWKFQITDEQESLAAMRQEDVRSKKLNSITHNATTMAFINRVGGPNGYTNRLGYFPKRYA